MIRILTSIVRGIGFVAGVVGWLISSRFRMQAEIDRLQAGIATEHERRRKLMEQWETHIEPQVLIAKDEYGLTHRRMRFPDSQPMTKDEVFAIVGQKAVNLACRITEDTGQAPAAVMLETRFVTHGRCLKFPAVVHLQPLEKPGWFFVSIPASERRKWNDLDRAMKCFLN